MPNSRLPKKNGNAIKKIAEFKFHFDLKTIFIIFFVSLFGYYIFNSISKEVKQALPEKSFTTILQEIKDKKIEKVEIIDNKILAYYKNDKLAVSYKEEGESFVKTLKDAGISTSALNVVVKDTKGSVGLINFLSNIIP